MPQTVRRLYRQAQHAIAEAKDPAAWATWWEGLASGGKPDESETTMVSLSTPAATNVDTCELLPAGVCMRGGPEVHITWTRLAQTPHRPLGPLGGRCTGRRLRLTAACTGTHARIPRDRVLSPENVAVLAQFAVSAIPALASMCCRVPSWRTPLRCEITTSTHCSGRFARVSSKSCGRRAVTT